MIPMDPAMFSATDTSMATPLAVDPNTAFEAKRKVIAQALMAQRGMGKPSAMGNFANSALQAWNMARKPPQQLTSTPDSGLLSLGQ